MENLNMTDPLEIKHALERALGSGAMSRIAEEKGVSRSTVTNVVKGRRPGSPLLPYMAGVIGQPVHGVGPLD